MTATGDAILVVGGYGTIGRTVCNELANSVSEGVIAAGRSPEKAHRFADTIAGVNARTLDVNEESFDESLAGVGTVVMCLDAADATFARSCFERGIDYVDISPDDSLLRDIETADGIARKNGSTAVLSVGLSPGMTNLFVSDAAAELDTVDRADITLLLGLGEAFGPDTIKWTVEDAFGHFSVQNSEQSISVTGLTEPRMVRIPEWGRRRAYRANLADQQVLARTTDIPTVESRLCYDSRVVTRYLAALRRTGLFQPVVSMLGVNIIVKLADTLPVGSDESVIKTAVRGSKNGRLSRIEQWVRGPDQARATALVAVQVTSELVGSSQPAGVLHIQELFDSSPFVETLLEGNYEVGRTQQQGRVS